MNDNDIQALQFRDELIKLCKKYNCELSGSCYDDGTMNLEIYDKKNGWTSQYIVNGKDENYNLYREDKDYNKKTNFYDFVCIMDLLIKKFFSHESGEMAGLNNIKISCGVITNDFGKAKLKFQELRGKYGNSDVEGFVMGRDYMELRLTNGERYVWIKPCNSNRGYRCGKIIVDRNITLEEFNEIVKPICYACGRDDVEIF